MCDLNLFRQVEMIVLLKSNFLFRKSFWSVLRSLFYQRRKFSLRPNIPWQDWLISNHGARRKTDCSSFVKVGPECFFRKWKEFVCQILDEERYLWTIVIRGWPEPTRYGRKGATCMSCLNTRIYRIWTSRVSTELGSIIKSLKNARTFKVNPRDQLDKAKYGQIMSIPLSSRLIHHNWTLLQWIISLERRRCKKDSYLVNTWFLLGPQQALSWC